MRAARWLASGLAVFFVAEFAAAQGDPYQSLQGAGTVVTPAVVPVPDHPLPPTFGEMKVQPFGEGYHDTPHLIAAQAQAPAEGGAAGGGGGAGEGGGGGGGGKEENNGTNPAQNATTFVVANEYYTLEGQNKINTTYARFKFPIYGGRGSVLFETPFVYYNFKATDPDLPNIGGLGDIKMQGSFNTWSSPNKKVTLINFLEMYLPTADNAIVARGTGNQLTAFNLGTGKYVIGPGVGVVYAFAPNFIIAPLYFYEASIFGDPDRQDIRRGKWRLFLMYAWKCGAYVLPEFQVLTNYLTWNHDVYVAPEVGFSRKGTTVYVKPGVGIAPDVNDRQWGIEFGARVMF